MKIEKLNEDKIKITFNLDDLAEKHIDLYSFIHNTPETQDLFWDILNQAEKECGFNVDNSMIYVEASTSGAGNFIVIVTKTNEKPVINTSVGTAFKKKQFKLAKKNISINEKQNIYQFDSFDDICDFANIIDTQKITNDSLYSMGGKYYLKSQIMPYKSILDFATISVYPEILEAKLNEYGELKITTNALQTISKYFNKKKRK